jgi:hypothetical protein
MMKLAGASAMSARDGIKRRTPHSPVPTCALSTPERAGFELDLLDLRLPPDDAISRPHCRLASKKGTGDLLFKVAGAS